MLDLNKRLMIFDGAVGTELYERGFYINRLFEELNLSAPADVRAVHESYVAAGADVLTTNTFSIARPQLKKFDLESQQEALLTAALHNANDARKKQPQVQIGLSVGPLGVLVEPLGSYGLDEAKKDFADISRIAVQAARLETGSFELYLLETFTQINELVAAIEGIRSVDSQRPIVASISVRSIDTPLIESFAAKIGIREEVQALGLNCCEGPSDLLSSLKHLVPLTQKPIVVRPNAGIPRHINGRYFYMTSPDYLAKYAKRFAEAGARAIGGCCGTGPDHIRAIRNAVRMIQSQRDHRISSSLRIEVVNEPDQRTDRVPLEKRKPYSALARKLSERKKVISIEVLPPKGSNLSSFFTSISELVEEGIEFINIPDGARASARVSSLHLASVLQNRFQEKLAVIPHFTTRDRNLIALQSDLLGVSVAGVHQVLLVTGDPPKLGNNRDATGVYDIDAIGLTYLADCLNRGTTPSGDRLGSESHFVIGVASNPTAINHELELQRWKYKVQSGADYTITQPIFNPESYLRWRDQLSELDRPHVVGIWPLVSLRNAEFMANEVPGVHVPPSILEIMEKCGEDRSEAEKRGIEIAQNVMSVLEKNCEGFCISAPLGRTDIALQALGKR